MYSQSDSINELLAALLEARKEISNPIKNAEAKGMKGGKAYKYANIEAVLDAIDAPCKKYGLIVQQMHGKADHEFWLLTRLTHAPSSQWQMWRSPLICSPTDSQAVGTSCTYARRYALQNMFCLAAEDDDGQAEAESKKAEAEAKEKSKPDFKARSAIVTHLKSVGISQQQATEFVNALVEALHDEDAVRECASNPEILEKRFQKWVVYMANAPLPVPELVS